MKASPWSVFGQNNSGNPDISFLYPFPMKNVRQKSSKYFEKFRKIFFLYLYRFNNKKICYMMLGGAKTLEASVKKTKDLKYIEKICLIVF